MEDETLVVRAAECLDTLSRIQLYRYWLTHPSEVLAALHNRELADRERQGVKGLLKPDGRDEAWVEKEAMDRLPYLYGTLGQQFFPLMDAAKQRGLDSTPLELVLEAVRLSEPKCDLPLDHGVSDKLLSEARAAVKRLGMPDMHGRQTPTAMLTVSLNPPQAVLRGQAYALSTDGATFLDGLLKANGAWQTGPKTFPNMRASRVRSALPAALRDLIESAAPYGFRIDTSKLA